MKPEVEVRFLGVNYDSVRTTLRRAGAKQMHGMQFMKRVIIDYPDQRMQRRKGSWAFVRLRDEGSKVMLTYKLIQDNEKYDTHEVEVEVSSFDKTIELFEAIGLKVISEQHTRREVWKLRSVEVSLDDWPWLPPMIELEGPDEARLQEVASVLGFEWSKRIYGNSVIAYRMTYPGMTDQESVRDIEKLTFEEMPQWLKDRKERSIYRRR